VIAEDIERKVQPVRHFPLMLAGLSAEAEDISMKPQQVLVMIAEAACLWGAPPCSGN